MAYIDPASAKVNLPFGDLIMATAAFAPNHFTDNVYQKHLNEEFNRILGMPDAIQNENTFYKLENGSAVILLFGDYLIQDRKGKDIYLFGNEDYSNIKVGISVDGTKWLNLGRVKKSSNSVNLKKHKVPTNYYKYLKLTNVARQAEEDSFTLIDAVAISLQSNNLKRYYPIPTDTLAILNPAPIIRIKDSKITDGDRIELKVDDLEKNKIRIGARYAKLEIDNIEKGLHRIRIKALNSGLIPPNTFRIEVVDGDDIYFKSYRINKGKTIYLYFEKL